MHPNTTTGLETANALFGFGVKTLLYEQYW